MFERGWPELAHKRTGAPAATFIGTLAFATRTRRRRQGPKSWRSRGPVGTCHPDPPSAL